ncbi:MAG: insulinase family protein, partial [Deltaproteobacteria bacterium]|nr:insulinase family protein [Deltaproteobacteria bacterium]
EWVAKAYGGWERGTDARLPATYAEKPEYSEAEGKVRSPARQFLMGFRIPDYHVETSPVADLAQHVFFESDYSLARRRLLHRLKFTSVITAFNSATDTGLMKLYAVPTPGHDREQIRDEVLKLGEDFEKLTDAELTAYLRQYQVGTAESVLRNDTLNEEVARSWGRYGDISYLAQTLERPLAVTRSEVALFAKNYFVKDNMVVVATPGME